jgi:hypothetical protein
MTASASRPLSDDDVDFALIFQDQVDHLACGLGSEYPATDSSARVARVLRRTGPWCQFEGGMEFGVGRQGVSGQRGDLFPGVGIHGDAVQLPTQSPVDQLGNLLAGNAARGGLATCLGAGGRSEHSEVRARVTQLGMRGDPPARQ